MNDVDFMRRALDLAARGRGRVEPNPMVGAVVVRDGVVVGEGYHEAFGGPHAEVHALRAAGDAARGATLYVTLEPCCHHGKTPPCTDAVIASGVVRVVAAMTDPFPEVAGGGLAQLRAAGVAVELGAPGAEAKSLNAPFVKLVATGRPWLVAKWAMTLDGKIATRTGHSQWISSEASRARVHELRGRVDAVMVGVGTALADDPRLTARPPGPRTATRVVVDSRGRTPLTSALVQTAREVATLVATTAAMPDAVRDALSAAGCEVVTFPDDGGVSLPALLDEMGRRRWTNVLCEGGGELLGALMGRGLVDEVIAFVAPMVVGGRDAPGPVAGTGFGTMMEAWRLGAVKVEVVGGDVMVTGRLRSL